jgi:1,5-anhydro-D-fructose reductase (1,5-anhydro-D-mannitol-forming)
MIKIGIVGVGGLGQLHLRNFLAQPDVAVVALATLSGQLKETVATNLKESGGHLDLSRIPVRRGFEPVCTDPGIDVVVVALPTDLHAAAAVLALESGKHVFSEKPMARTVADARRMLAAAQASGKQLMIGHCLRFWPEYLAVESLLRSAQYGKALAASFARCGGCPTWGSQGWFNQPQRSGGAAIDLHIHDADTALWWWGPPRDIRAGGRLLNGAPNIVHSQWRYPDGLALQFEACWDTVKAAPFYYSFKITLERATLLFDSRNDKGLLLATDDSADPIPLDQGSAYEREDRYFLDAIQGRGTLDRCPPTDSLRTLECVAETARQMGAA